MAGLAFAALTHTCAMGMLLARAARTTAVATCDLRTVVAQLVDRQPTDESEPTAMIALTIVLAVVVGVSLGLLGGGGSILTVPLLAYVAGMDAKQAIATSLLVVGVTSAVGAISHARAGRVQWRTGLVFGAAGMAGAYAGGLLARFIPGTVLLVGFAVMMIATAVAMLRGRKDVSSRRGHAIPAGASRSCSRVVAVGLVTGLVGAGGGFLVVPALASAGRTARCRWRSARRFGRDRDEVVRRVGRSSLQRAYRLAPGRRWSPAAALVGGLIGDTADRDGRPRLRCARPSAGSYWRCRRSSSPRRSTLASASPRR